MGEIRYYKKGDGSGVVMRAFVDEDGRYIINIKRLIRQYASVSRTKSDAKAGILTPDRAFDNKDEPNDFFLKMKRFDNLIPAKAEDWDNLNVD